MLKRIFSTLTLWAVVATSIYYGKSAGWSVLIFILSLGSVKEVCDLLERLGYSPLRKTAQAANVAIFLSAFFGYLIDATLMGGVFAFSLFSIAISASIIKRPYDEYAGKSAIPTILALIVPLSLQWLVVATKAFPDAEASEYAGIIVAMWIVAAAKFSDVGAYVIGAAFGRKKMSPTISPNKTIEGAVGGVVSSALISGVIFGYARPVMPIEISIAGVMLAGAFIGAVAIISDLLESVLKRRADIKDSGKFIPGIGGALDLSDSLVLTSPLGFILFWITITLL